MSKLCSIHWVHVSSDPMNTHSLLLSLKSPFCKETKQIRTFPDQRRGALCLSDKLYFFITLRFLITHHTHQGSKTGLLMLSSRRIFQCSYALQRLGSKLLLSNRKPRLSAYFKENRLIQVYLEIRLRITISRSIKKTIITVSVCLSKTIRTYFLAD